MNLDFADGGNGPEVLWAGMFTLVAVIGSVLLALWSQRRDFDKREKERKSALAAQEESDWSNWRRHIAERCMALVSRAANLSMGHHIHRADGFSISQEADELTALLHLDLENVGPVLGDWMTGQVWAMTDLAGDADGLKKVAEIAARTRARIMQWALAPRSILADEEIVAAARHSHASASHDRSEGTRTSPTTPAGAPTGRSR